MEKAILVNLERCTGCWTCSLACKVGNNLDDDTFWCHVRTLGSGAGIDKPQGQWPDLKMRWLPVWTSKCIKCPARTKRGDMPYCVDSCPNNALVFGEAVEEKLQELSARGYRTFKLPHWEDSSGAIVYAERS